MGRRGREIVRREGGREEGERDSEKGEVGRRGREIVRREGGRKEGERDSEKGGR